MQLPCPGASAVTSFCPHSLGCVHQCRSCVYPCQFSSPALKIVFGSQSSFSPHIGPVSQRCSGCSVIGLPLCTECPSARDCAPNFLQIYGEETKAKVRAPLVDSRCFRVRVRKLKLRGEGSSTRRASLLLPASSGSQQPLSPLQP